MIGRNKHNSGEFDSLIGINTVIEGNIKCGGTLRVDGTVNGDILAKGEVFIGKTAAVKGNITAENMEISGSIQGNIRTTGIFKLHTTAKLIGDIEVHSFIADEGAVFQGSCNMVESGEAKGTGSKILGKYGKDRKTDDYLKSGIIDEP